MYMYTFFNRPHLEYVSKVWDRCSLADSIKLLQVQLNVARIVTGLTIFASRDYLYY